MNEAHTGAARPPPVACRLPRPREKIGTGASIPNQTVARRFGVKPVNHTSVPSFVVPVLPAAGTWYGRAPRTRIALYPVPRITTSSSIETMIRATRLSRTWVCSGCGSQSTTPSESSTRRMGNGRTLVPRLGKAEYASATWIGITSDAPIVVEGNRSISV